MNFSFPQELEALQGEKEAVEGQIAKLAGDIAKDLGLVLDKTIK